MKWIAVIIFWFSFVSVYAEVDVVSLKQVNQINKGLKYVQRQINRGISKIHLKKYSLGTTAKKPLFFRSNDDIIKLYMIAFLQKARPYWLENDIFVFHTSSNKNYLKKLQRIYKRRYNIETTLYENQQYKKISFGVRTLEYNEIKTYMDKLISKYFTRKNSKKKAKIKKHKYQKIAIEKIDKQEIITATIKRKKEANLVYHSFKYLDKYKEECSINLRKYILYVEAEKPWFFGSMDMIYNLYLIAILNGAYPKWLEDERFILHTSNNIQYLKRLKRVYNKRYHLKLSVVRVSSRKQRTKAIESDDLKAYMLERIPNRYIIKRRKQKNKIGKKPSQKKVENQEVRTTEVRTKREAYLAQKGIHHINMYSDRISTKLGKYILYKSVETPFFFSSYDHIYNLYLTAMIHGGSPKWLADTKFVMHTASRKRYLKRLQKFYQKKYHISLLIAKVPSYYREEFALHRLNQKNLKVYIEERIAQKSIKNALAKKIRLKQLRQKRLQKQIDAVEIALMKLKEKKEKLEEKKQRLLKEKDT